MDSATSTGLESRWLEWEGSVWLRGHLRAVRLCYYPDVRTWQAYERHGQKWRNLNRKPAVAEVLAAAVFELLKSKTAGFFSGPLPAFEDAYSAVHKRLLTTVAELRQKVEAGTATKHERKRLLHALDELQGHEAQDESWEGKGPLMSEIARVQIGLLRHQIDAQGRGSSGRRARR